MGNLTNLEILHLQQNALSGKLPPEWGQMVNLRHLMVYDNPLTGLLPVELGALERLEIFWYQGTDLCTPDDADFQTWLGGVNTRSDDECDPALYSE